MVRYKAGQKEQTRQRMLEAAGRCFRSGGFAGVGVDGIAKEAGATSGAFYGHFGSKDAVFREAVDAGLDEVLEGVPLFQREHGEHWVEAFAEYYLGATHRGDLPTGCAMTTLSPEVVRAGPETRTGYEAKMVRIAGLIADGLAGGSADERRDRAWAMLGVLIGGLTIARAVNAPGTADAIATAIRTAAVTAAGPARAVNAD